MNIGDKIVYAFLFVWVKLHAMLPMPVLYFFSDILYVIIYKIFHYRIKVVRENLHSSFPEKSKEELLVLERRFYHHFTDYIFETIKLAHISLEEVKRRAVLENPEIVEELIEQGHPMVFMLMGHYGNWEWFSHATAIFPRTTVYQIYRPLNNKAFDKLFIYLRTRFDSIGIRKHDTVREILRLKKEKEYAGVIFIADQATGTTPQNYWTIFLNHETAMQNGAEKIARKQNIPVLFLDVQKKKRGYYTVNLRLMTTSPKEMPEGELTEQYTRMLEHMIRRDPAYWLWTHKRFKYKRPQV